MISAQGVASLGLLPLTIWFFGQSSLIGPLANLIAVPVVCFLILPLGVAGALLQLAVPLLGTPLLMLAGCAMQALWWLLERMADWPAALCYSRSRARWAFALAMLGARGCCCRAARRHVAWGFAAAAAADSCTRVLADGEFEALMLDVGQGLSLVVRTREHTLVYDAGARFPSGFDLGERRSCRRCMRPVSPASIGSIISHGDNDHAGGAAAVLAAFPHAVWAAANRNACTCRRRNAWPARRGTGTASTSASFIRMSRCLRRTTIAAACRSAQRQQRLAADRRHHRGGGGRGGDWHWRRSQGIRCCKCRITAARLRPAPRSSMYCEPELALISSGYRNRFNHPNPAVVARYRAAGIALLDTPRSGFVDYRFAADTAPRLSSGAASTAIRIGANERRQRGSPGRGKGMVERVTERAKTGAGRP